MRAWFLMLAIFCSKNYIPVDKKQIAQKKNRFAILTELAEKRFTIQQARQRLDLQPSLIP
jgi:hypothetical protein